MTRMWKITFAIAGLLVLGGGTLEAQRRGGRGLREVDYWSTGGGGLMLALPVGEFRDFVGVHGGLGGAVTIGGPLGFRIGGSLLVYGHERQFLPVGGGRVLLDVDTDNMIGTLGIGPQLTVGEGPLRLYGYSLLALSYFTTVSSLGDNCGCGSLASTTNFDDLTLAQETGGGLQIALSRRRPVFLDLSARYLRNGRVEYLREGGIVEHPDGTISLRTIESEANLVVFQLGVSLGLR